MVAILSRSQKVNFVCQCHTVLLVTANNVKLSHKVSNNQQRVISFTHYSYVIMGATASQITSLAIVYSSVYSGADQRKHKSSASLAFVGNSPVTGEFPTQRVSNAENVSIWWRHHDISITVSPGMCLLIHPHWRLTAWQATVPLSQHDATCRMPHNTTVTS